MFKLIEIVAWVFSLGLMIACVCLLYQLRILLRNGHRTQTNLDEKTSEVIKLQKEINEIKEKDGQPILGPIEKFTKLSVIGKGGFGFVFHFFFLLIWNFSPQHKKKNVSHFLNGFAYIELFGKQSM